MNTNELIDMLASHAPAVDRRVVARRFTLAIAVGLLLGLLGLLVFLGIRPDLAEVARTPLFWLKLAFPASLLGGSLWMTARLARPGMPVGASWAAVATPLTIVWLAALGLLFSVSSGSRHILVLGETWRTCPVNIALLSIPAFVSVFWAIRGLAPTRPRLAGAAGGLLASSTATLAYSLHCPEMSVAFWAVWYVLGMAVPSAIGALLGPRLLRW
ncbi:DUF1109 domain-containing protein [Pseudomonas sp. PS1]|uniref:DUF1109 domain-containing protein n=1 Tax=Stutzerimonas marianensis TaxID=2929513 RepID=A0A9X1W0S7_9GAMM|nr:DUF1109 domain-containing protein [Pseudomonas marianensis]MCJ0972941.1 DUF1109 domain-containing protein [Pseudomonas marianensis]